MKTEKEKEVLKKHGISPTTLSMEDKFPEYSPSNFEDPFKKIKESKIREQEKEFNKLFEKYFILKDRNEKEQFRINHEFKQPYIGLKETIIKLFDLAYEIIQEVLKAQKKFDPFHNSHEGIAVIREEYLELEQEVFKNQYKYPERIPNMRAEAIQLGSMAIRLILDICDNPNSWENSIHPKSKPVMEFLNPKKESEI